MPFSFFSKKKNPNVREDKITYYKVCPNCINPNISLVKEFTSGWLTPPKYYCPSCKYSGLLVLEVDITIFETKSPQEIKQMFLEEEFDKIEDD
jgi:hypothetical protein